MLPTFALVAAAWLISRPEFRRVVRSDSVAALTVTASVLLILFYGQRFR
ncbi:MAG: hypothetical protein IT299_02275 [Dehalococcoidia bacterium]|nr:hypothetical protein [Dehalococcoidia bacterium]